MLRKVLILNTGGVGDQIQGFQCAEHVSKACDYPTVCCLSRPEVYEPLFGLFGPYFEMFRHEEGESWGENYWILNNLDVLEKYKKEKGFDDAYLVCPDLLYRSKLGFDYERYCITPKVINQTRLLLDDWNPGNQIGIFLNSNTDRYLYQHIGELTKYIAGFFPDYEIYLPILKNWAGKEILHSPLPSLPQNVIVDENPTFLGSIKKLKESCYVVVADNGFFHIANQLGVPKLLLDPRFSLKRDAQPWLARWRPFGLEESLPIDLLPQYVAKVVKINIETPETQLIASHIIPAEFYSNWNQNLILKF